MTPDTRPLAERIQQLLDQPPVRTAASIAADYELGLLNEHDWFVPASELEAALSAGSGVPPAPQGWQPIETAPKDGTSVLLWWPFWCKGRPTIGFFGYKGIQQWFAPESLEGDGDQPIAWMPLPAPPVSEEAQK